ncbi:hypothetical protein DICVIV_12005 [Dictyocaulus viviparus]|uniref:Uncharacterized protein n=1 Tax=Dictyocaulus viviparus TaxID=29172 RepID=A0A0D8XBQ1_DICVI|nr:hypothetical protein DICVIV_12005 [Dictyocaulus viviparus]
MHYLQNVNNLVETLTYSNAVIQESKAQSIPVTPENMSRREREIARRNKSFIDPAALRVAFKIDPSVLNDSLDSSIADIKKPIALSRCTRRIRTGNVKPNLNRGTLFRGITISSSTTAYTTTPFEVKEHLDGENTPSMEINTDGECMQKEPSVETKNTVSSSLLCPAEMTANLSRRRRFRLDKKAVTNHFDQSDKDNEGYSTEIAESNQQSLAVQHEAVQSEVPLIADICESSQITNTRLKRGRRSSIKPCLPSSDKSRKSGDS